MSTISPDIINSIIIGGIYLAILLTGELIRHFFPSYPEFSRKAVHFLAGCLSLSLPYMLRSHWAVLVLTSGSALILFLSERSGILRSVHNVGRRTYGVIYFPAAVYLLFLLSHDRPVLYTIPVLVMTVSDTMAALIGGRYGSIRFEVEENTKSLEGSTVFFFVTFLCIHLSLLLMTGIERLDSVMIAFVIALLVTGFEAISVTGSDNIFVPLGTYYILAKMTGNTRADTAGQIGILLIMIAVTVVISMKSRIFKTSGLIGMILVNYAAWSLCGALWVLPLLLAQIMLYLLVRFFAGRVPADIITGHQIRMILYTASLPVALIFIAITMQNQDAVYLPYITSIAGQISVIFSFFLSVTEAEDASLLQTLRRSLLIRGICCSAVSLLFIAFVPILLRLKGAFLPSVLISGGGVCLSTFLFHILSSRYNSSNNRRQRQVLRLVSVGAAVIFVFMIRQVIPDSP